MECMQQGVKLADVSIKQTRAQSPALPPPSLWPLASYFSLFPIYKHRDEKKTYLMELLRVIEELVHPEHSADCLLHSMCSAGVVTPLPPPFFSASSPPPIRSSEFR